MAANKGYRTSVYVGIINGQPKYKTVRAKTKSELNRKVNAIKTIYRAVKMYIQLPVLVIWQTNGTRKRNSQAIYPILH